MKQKTKKTKVPTMDSKVLGRRKDKLGKLTFGDMHNLMKLLKKYKGPLPAGLNRKHCHACTCKRP